MSSTRRQFLDSLAMGAAVVGASAAIPSALAAMPSRLTGEFRHDIAQGAWDTRWPAKLTGRVKTVFDVPEVESGYGVWRASIWARQYEAVLGTPMRELSTALVLRHNAIVLAMQQGFWDKYGIGAVSKATHPLTSEPTGRNPALLGAADGVGAPYDAFALPKFLERGGVALACDLALQDMVAIIAKADGVTEAAAKEQAVRWMAPGVILQPSGVFAVLRAQQEGALYIRAS